MLREAGWYSSAIESGDPALVGAALRAVRMTWPSDRARLVEENVDWCRERYGDGDPCQRRAVVRFLRELARATAGLDRADRPRPRSAADTWWVVEEILLAAVRDDDPSVRRTAVRAAAALAAAYERSLDDRSIERLTGRLNTLATADSDGDTAVAVLAALRTIREETGRDVATDGLACPRCGDHVERYELQGSQSLSCVGCGYMGVPVASPDEPTTRETWPEAVQRFRERAAAD
ncbi:hypothetical protein SAMN05216559_2659 [Halomicrobium zhouii]|uniref:HEAT repeat-containing protein n=1 Tax=Halomicrobium zhouii TaxID=767519 RepID=A0A1I6LGB0_9EURY|nr:hypothetical protein [Halomicrobium zhouii]SFS02555.1 hypothetical protein SAMN05216559_2659 [Halomicrobium zhouii]